MQLSQSYRQEHNPIARSASGSADHHHERWSVRMRIVNTAMILTVTFGVGWAMSGCGAGDNTQAFCKIAAISTQNRNDAQIDAYYDQLKKVAPEELVSDNATLRSKWKSVSIPLGDVLSGQVQKVSRPPEVTKAANNVVRVVSEKCAAKRGVYVVLPQSGF
jgi:hypothetical protein